MKKQLTIKIFGRVQGVNFRRSLKKRADELGLVGFVKNLSDGSLIALAIGEESNLNELLLWSHKGPIGSKVTGMNFTWDDDIDESYNEFTIERESDNLVVDEAKSIINLGKTLIQKDEINVPKHVVIIPDGNRRWARKHGWKPWVGHRKAMTTNRMRDLFEEAKSLGIKYISFWGFSTENWDRDQQELDILWDIYRKMASKWKDEFIKQGVRFKHFGRKTKLDKDILESMAELEEVTKDQNKLYFQFCLDYNGRDDLVRAFNKILKEGINEVDEKTIAKYLDTGDHTPDPDLIIRTSGEKRTSGIMAYQAAYAELYFTDKYFPEFKAEDLRMAVLDYSSRTRRFGGTNVADLKNINVNALKDPEMERKGKSGLMGKLKQAFN